MVLSQSYHHWHLEVSETCKEFKTLCNDLRLLQWLDLAIIASLIVITSFLGHLAIQCVQKHVCGMGWVWGCVRLCVCVFQRRVSMPVLFSNRLPGKRLPSRLSQPRWLLLIPVLKHTQNPNIYDLLFTRKAYRITERWDAEKLPVSPQILLWADGVLK